jgi:para-aminobenzoate synthetase component 1
MRHLRRITALVITDNLLPRGCHFGCCSVIAEKGVAEAAVQFFVRELTSWIDPADVFLILFAKDENSFWLDGAANPNSPFTVMGHAQPGSQISAEQLFAALEASDSSNPPPQSPDADSINLPFGWRPGYVGWFNYRANPIAEDAVGSWLPANEAVILDHESRRIWFAGNFESRQRFEEWVRAALIRLGLAGGGSARYLHANSPKGPTALLRLAHNPEEYLDLVNRAKEHIAAGDVYQLCLTNRLDFSHQLDPLEVFLRLRQASPAPYSAYIRIGSDVLVSSSPEQFFGITDGAIRTKPIKGTRPRLTDPAADLAISEELRNDPKERAENLMIVDLMRNDLSRVSLAESVRVENLFEVESYARVHQLVSTISARLAPGVRLREVVDALLPGGSMTGAPKPMACQLIQNLEATPRGIYSGANGWISASSGLSLNLAMTIRSLVFDVEAAEVSIGVGGGITIDSNPKAELAETELKALALLEVIGAANPWQ